MYVFRELLVIISHCPVLPIYVLAHFPVGWELQVLFWKHNKETQDDIIQALVGVCHRLGFLFNTCM